MRSRTELIALAATIGLCVAQAQAAGQAGASYAPPQPEGGPPPSDGPQGSSQRRPGEARYDRVGHAGQAEGAGVFALSDALTEGSHAEVTALDSGRTILVVIRGRGERLIELSPGAASQLGVIAGAAVRVRQVSASAQDAALLAAGQTASPRADAPPALLAGLRRQLRGETNAAPAVASKPVSAPTPRPVRPAHAAATPAPKPAATATPKAVAATKTAPVATASPGRTWFVQVAALSNVQRAQALARTIGGTVRSSGSVHRVQTGPYANAAAAQKARADVARRGYGDARIVTNP